MNCKSVEGSGRGQTLGLIRIFEGDHSVVYYQIHIVVVPSIHNTWKTICFITTG